MSRVANNPLTIPKGVDVQIKGAHFSAKGSKGSMDYQIPSEVQLKQDENVITLAFDVENTQAKMLAGTTRANLNNVLVGVSEGFERKLTLIGVGYRAQAKGRTLNLTLGFSHPVDYALPEGIEAETPSQTEIIIKGMNKQKVGQVAAEIRAFRSPEPYKGKGVRYSDEQVVRKEAKKK